MYLYRLSFFIVAQIAQVALPFGWHGSHRFKMSGYAGSGLNDAYS